MPRVTYRVGFVELLCCFFFNDTATTEIYTLSLHDALPIFMGARHNLAQSRWGAYTVERLLDLTSCAGQLTVITDVLTQACADVRMLEAK